MQVMQTQKRVYSNKHLFTLTCMHNLAYTLLSLYVWRKTLCGGMPVVIPTTTKSTAPETPRESRDRDFHCVAFSTFFVFTSKFLRGWQYDNLRLACTAAQSRTASDALEARCMHLRFCGFVQRGANSVSQAGCNAISGRGAVVEIYCSCEQDR
jgi:hypothetical protein